MIYICEYDGLADDDRLRKLSRPFPFDVVKKAEADRQWQKRRERILAWLLLTAAVKREYGLAFEELQIKRSEKGKPYSTVFPEIHFNLSHCPVACACIVSDRNVGIDIERKFPYRKSLERKVCHREEKEVLESMGDKLREEQLRFLWSMKESYVKMDGRGLGYGMDRINLASFLPVLPEEKMPSGPVLLQSPENRQPDFVIQNTASYTLAACGPGLSDQLCLMRETELPDVFGGITEK